MATQFAHVPYGVEILCALQYIGIVSELAFWQSMLCSEATMYIDVEIDPHLSLEMLIEFAKVTQLIVFGNEPLEAGVTQLHERHSLEWFIVKYHNNICSHYCHAC